MPVTPLDRFPGLDGPAKLMGLLVAALPPELTPVVVTYPNDEPSSGQTPAWEARASSGDLPGDRSRSSGAAARLLLTLAGIG